ncbi:MULTISPECIES: SRPBCC family protein [unclassified Rhodococcus (in: high G+C Gram-positive bacteria)]|uniref:SRPBCC family protein n=1 Tax=unclassified Rhodococcus (in: high G+C Gram-positive bacteria) TaxID=192944 RepID=UPI0009281029|nr:SRPBCC family protein [Rhodococcus sp. M8]OLL18557.1 polyketide cyclase [Rhodococcus sp. M8]QPG47237.1 SRPBCC family protein [Rhodococcus sp. M8]
MSKTLEATVEIAASPQQVWHVISDLKRMGEWSPQCRKMAVLGGPVGVGTKTINVNRKGLLVWPTTAKVLAFEPGRLLRFRVNENRTVWSFTLEPTDTGTRVIQRREAPTGTSKVSQFLIDKVLGGATAFDDDMVVGMNATLARIRSEAEGAALAR